MQWSLSKAAKSDSPELAATQRPRLGLKPNTPHTDAGTRIEPPASLACARGTMPAATAAAEPPDDPAAERDRFQGLCVTPSASVSVLPSKPSSEAALLPTTNKPERSMHSLNGVGGAIVFCANKREPNPQRSPGYGVKSFTSVGTP